LQALYSVQKNDADGQVQMQVMGTNISLSMDVLGKGL
jgi:hypothetical protein